MAGKVETDAVGILRALPVAVYTTDADGALTYYNEAAAALWGERPALGSRALLAPAEMAADVLPQTRVLRDETGAVCGTVNILTDMRRPDAHQIELERLAAIVASSDDAIVSKTLDGRVTSWNAGAERIFGYTAEEMVGQSITRIIPPELQEEELGILARLRRGERIEHFDTVRVAKDGRRLDISLAVSPLCDHTGAFVGASKVARDITERKRSEKLRRLLFDELNHRVKNTLATIQAVASQSLRNSASPEDFVTAFNGRVQALARAHDQLVQGEMKGAELSRLVHQQVIPDREDGARIAIEGPHVFLPARLTVQLALVLHELVTNARKYGALSSGPGRLSIGWTVETEPQRRLELVWRESGMSDVRAPESPGFGTLLIERSLEGSGGSARMRYEPEGLICVIGLPLPAITHDDIYSAPPDDGPRPSEVEPIRADLRGKRILVVEDEPLVAMDLEAQLTAAGCRVVGQAATLAAGRQLIARSGFDAVVLDANLAGERTDELAASLTEMGIPFTYATGYGREALPRAYRSGPVLAKPFNSAQLIAAVERMFAPASDSDVNGSEAL